MPLWPSANTVYLTAHFSKSLLWHASNVLFAFYLTETCRLTPAYVGVLLASTLALNGVLDLSLGFWQRARIRTSADAARFQAYGALVTATFFGLFCATSLVSVGWRTQWALVTLLGFRFAYPFVDVGQNSLIALGNRAIAARKRLTAMRNMVSSSAALSVCLLLSPLLMRLSDQSGPRFTLAGIAISVLMAITAVGLALAGNSQEVETRDAELAPSQINLTFSTIILMTIVCATLGSLFNKLEPFFSAYALNQVSLGYNFPTAVALGSFLGQPIWIWSLKRAGQFTILTIGGLFLIVAGILLGTLTRTESEYAYLAGMLFGAGAGGLASALWVAAAAHPERIGATLCYGALTCASKGSQAVAALIIGLLFQGRDYRAAFSDPKSALSMLVEALPIIMGLLTLGVVLAKASRKKLAREQKGGSPDRRRRIRRQLGNA